MRVPVAPVLRHVVLMTAAALVLLPFAWMVATSLKPPAEIFADHIRWWPDRFYGVENYTAAFTKAPLGRFLLNGAIVTVSIFVIQVLVALPVIQI